MRSWSAALLVICCLGCTPPEPALLRVGTNLWIGYEPLYLADQLGYLDCQRVRLVELPSATDVMRAFRDGAIEAAALTLDELLVLRSQEHAPRVVLVMDISHGADAVLGRGDVTSLADLRGRRVGVEAGALGAYMLHRALATARLSADDVTIMPLTLEHHEAAFLAGRIDAVVTFEPVRSRLLAAGATLLFDSSKIPGEIVDVLAVRADFLQAHPAPVRLLIDAWFRAVADIASTPEAMVPRLGARLGLDASQTEASLRGIRLPDRAENLRMLAGPEAPFVGTARRLAAQMTEGHLLDRPVDFVGLATPRALEAP